MIFGETPEQHSARNDWTETLMQAWYDELDPELRNHFGPGLQAVLSARMDSHEDYSQAQIEISLWNMYSLTRDFPPPARTMGQAWEAVIAFTQAETKDQLTGYEAIDRLQVARREVLAKADGDPDVALRLMDAVNATIGAADRIRHLIDPPAAYGA